MNIKNIVTLLTAVLIFAPLQSTHATGYNMDDINQKTKAITDKRLNVFVSSIEVQDLFGALEFQSLRAKCNTDWQPIMENIEKVQGGDEAIKLIIYAFENLSPQNYITVLEGLVSKYESGVIGEGIVRSLFRPLGKMGAFAIDNCNHPRMTTVLNRLKSKTKIAAVKVDIDGILNGSAKLQLDEYRDNLAGTPEGDIPKVILPP